MKREERLTQRARFAAIFKDSKSWANPFLVLRALPNGLETNRYGFSVSKRVGKAVVRNRVRRRLREGIMDTPIKLGWDLVFISRTRAATADFNTLKKAIEGLLSQARLIQQDQGTAVVGRGGA